MDFMDKINQPLTQTKSLEQLFAFEDYEALKL